MSNVVNSGDTLLYTGPGVVTGLSVTNSSATAATFTLYDNTAKSGTKIFEAHLVAGQPLIVFFPSGHELLFETGLYQAAGAGLVASVWYAGLA